MSDTREKLIELICDGTLKTEICTTDTHLECETCKGDCGYCTILADHLIANGVTVQEWIPVSERLPELSLAHHLQFMKRPAEEVFELDMIEDDEENDHEV